MNKKRTTLDTQMPEASAKEGGFVRLASGNFDSLVLQDTRVYKAGNSLVIRIPSAIAKHCDLKDGAPMEMAADNGMIYLRKAPSRELGELLERITPENVHRAQFDESVGGERW
jgi:antitoxin component of MazEF toxin-antitoxin module